MSLADLTPAQKEELVVSLSALLLQDSGVDMSAENLESVIQVRWRWPLPCGVVVSGLMAWVRGGEGAGGLMDRSGCGSRRELVFDS